MGDFLGPTRGIASDWTPGNFCVSPICEPMNKDKLTPGQKALQINLDARKYGTFAEIGAGQKVARCDFIPSAPAIPLA